MAVGIPTCPNCGQAVWPVAQDLNAEQTWRCSSCEAHGTVAALGRGDWMMEK